MKKKRKLKKKSVFIVFLILICIGVGIYFYLNPTNKSNPSQEKEINEKKETISKEDKEFIDKIKKEYSLTFDVPSKYVELFKKYSEVIENNDKITDYKKYVYNLFQVVMSEGFQRHFKEEYFFNKLTDLTIKVDDSLEDNWANGLYYADTTLVAIPKGNYIVLYHELMHFMDDAINTGFGYNLWKCDNKILSNDEKNQLSDEKQDLCEYIIPDDITFIMEAGAELYSTKYFKKGVVAYFDVTTYYTALEYILGSEKVDDFFFGGDGIFMKFMIDNGYTMEEYQDIIDDLAYYAVPAYNSTVVSTEGKAVDLLIDLYKKYKTGKDWKQDEVFTYMLRMFLDMGNDSKYKNSKYKSDLDKIVYKSFDDFLEREDTMLKQIPSNIEFNNTPIPPYIINNELYLGSRIKIDGKKADNTFGYIKYDFDTKKIIYSNYKYEAE